MILIGMLGCVDVPECVYVQSGFTVPVVYPNYLVVCVLRRHTLCSIVGTHKSRDSWNLDVEQTFLVPRGGTNKINKNPRLHCGETCCNLSPSSPPTTTSSRAGKLRGIDRITNATAVATAAAAETCVK
ncbi:uncharacterized protein LOC115255018 [Aedes albopictus]|uniref:Secreted protein n=1 Tax=Aedes albopictus TaxID=7160 RepID=A0ABM1ZX69_AEDAL